MTRTSNIFTFLLFYLEAFGVGRLERQPEREASTSDRLSATKRSAMRESVYIAAHHPILKLRNNRRAIIIIIIGLLTQ